MQKFRSVFDNRINSWLKTVNKKNTIVFSSQNWLIIKNSSFVRKIIKVKLQCYLLWVHVAKRKEKSINSTLRNFT